MVIAITGGTGFIGQHLRKHFSNHTVRIAGRKLPNGEFFEGADAVVNLAGEPVAQRWSDAIKKRILDSRVNATRDLIATLKTLERRPSVLVSASAIGFYGDGGSRTLTEDSQQGPGFLADVCAQWEQASREAEALGIRVVNPRIGLVLGLDGGALAKMLPAFRWGAGGRLGAGDQWMSWIHIGDLARLFQFAIEDSSVKGAVNAVAPNPVTNAEFTAQLARTLSRPAILPVPRFALKLLFGEMAEMLLTGQRALPAAAIRAGFTFQYPELTPALQSLI
jgi:uncharacterized protein (TIGR01777 family)